MSFCHDFSQELIEGTGYESRRTSNDKNNWSPLRLKGSLYKLWYTVPLILVFLQDSDMG